MRKCTGADTVQTMTDARYTRVVWHTSRCWGRKEYLLYLSMRRSGGIRVSLHFTLYVKSTTCGSRVLWRLVQSCHTARSGLDAMGKETTEAANANRSARCTPVSCPR